jgi:hypothetical protein
MRQIDISKDALYTDNLNRYRRPIAFFDDEVYGTRRVQYKRMAWISNKQQWISFGSTKNCTKESFAKWAKSKVKGGKPS